jgi:hypothetical protein
MSATTTIQAQPAVLQTVLQDYRLHHSEASGDAAKVESSRSLQNTAATSQPPAWDVPHRRVPPHRPTNRERDQAETSVYLNGIERTFITTMFTGLFINAVGICLLQCRKIVTMSGPSLRNELTSGSFDGCRPQRRSGEAQSGN